MQEVKEFNDNNNLKYVYNELEIIFGIFIYIIVCLVFKKIFEVDIVTYMEIQ